MHHAAYPSTLNHKKKHSIMAPSIEIEKKNFFFSKEVFTNFKNQTKKEEIDIQI